MSHRAAAWWRAIGTNGISARATSTRAFSASRKDVIVANSAPASVADILDRAAVALASSGGGESATVLQHKLTTTQIRPHVVTRNGEEVECSWVPNAC